MPTLTDIAPGLLPFFFVGLWCGILWLLSLQSGWRRLATEFHYPEKFIGKRYRFQSARMKGVNFNGALTMGANEQGLYLVPMILFRPFHKPLLIPWSEINATPFKQFIVFKGYRLSFRDKPDITLELQERTFKKMIDYLQTEVGEEA